MAVLISIVIPVYNAGSYLLQTVTSVLEQTVSNYELILVDDGSTDDCLAPVVALGDPRVQILRQNNRGAPAALNRALATARGRYVAFLDHDDIWLPRKLEAHIEYFEMHPEADLTFSWSSLIDAHGRDMGIHSRRWRGPISFDQLLEDFVIGNTSAIVVRRDALERIGPLDESLLRAYDLDMCLRIALLGPGNCQAVPEELSQYRRHPGQMSRDWRQARPEWLKLLARVIEYHPRASQQALCAGNSNMHRYFAWLAYEEGRHWDACRLIGSALRLDPSRAVRNRRNWMLGAACTAGLLLPARVHQALESKAKSWSEHPMPSLAPLAPFLIPALVLLAWQVAVDLRAVDPLLVPAPAHLASAAVRLTQSGELPVHLAATLLRLAAGFALGALSGLAIGILLGMLPWFRRFVEPLLSASSAVPKVTLLPLMMLLVGVNETARILPVAASCFVIMAFHALDAVRGIEQSLVHLARNYGAGQWQLFRCVYLPSSLPSVFTGLRIAMGTSLIVTISTELLGAPAGLGFMIWSSWQTFSIDKLYLGIALTAMLGLFQQATLAWLQRRLIPWQHEHE